MTPSDTTTPIKKRDVPYTMDVINTSELRFWDENPRVYAAVQGHPDFANASPQRKQAIIYQQMLKEESTARAKEGMERHGGLQEPLIVDLRGNIVVEGNSRLAAARKLAEKDENHWGALECKCYNDITEEEKIALLNQMHIQGKVQWTPYAKAATYYRQWEKRHEDPQWTQTHIAEVNGVSQSHVSQQIKIIETMVVEGDNEPRKYSWYKVVVDNKKLVNEFDRLPGLQERVMETVKKARTADNEDTNTRAAFKFRDELRAITAKPKILADYAKGKLNLDKAAERARMSSTAQKLRKAREHLQAIEKEDVDNMEDSERNETRRIVKRVRQELDRVAEFLNGGNHRDG